jgi:hypothetical protein
MDKTEREVDGCRVDGILGTLSEETVERLAIQPGQTTRL